MSEKLYNNQLRKVEKLEKGIHTLQLDGESKISTPKLRQLEKTISNFYKQTEGAAGVFTGDLATKFSDLGERVSNAADDLAYLEELKELNDLKQAKDIQLNIIINKLENLKTSITSEYSVEDKKIVKAKVAGYREQVERMGYRDMSEDKMKEVCNLMWDVTDLVYIPEPTQNGSVAVGSLAGSAQDNCSYKEERVEWKTLPTFSGDVARYSVFKGAF